jgi:S1-C subfamily serine protease
MPRLSCVVGYLLLASALTARADEFQEATYEKVASALVRVRSQCASGYRQGQGFIADSGRHVVTARHVVAGCSSLFVDFFTGADHDVQSDTQQATLVRSVKASDLALLDLQAPVANFPSLTWSVEQVAAGTPIYAVARWVGASGITAAPMEVVYGSSKLRTHVDGIPQVLHQLEESKSPSLDLDIINITRVIVPGTSGAPLVNGKGIVVGIADGGLQGGLTGVNWAIPATYLSALTTSTEPRPTANDGTLASTLFAAEPSANVTTAGAIACGQAALVKLKSLSYSESASLTDDPAGLQYLLSQTVVNPNIIRFDVYQDFPTGAVVVLPEGARFRAAGKDCKASADGGRVTFDVRIDGVDSPIDVQSKSEIFERDFVGQRSWFPVPGFTYPIPITRFDGLTTRRKMAAAYAPLAGVAYQPSPSPVELAFETFATRGRALLSYVAQADTSGHNWPMAIASCTSWNESPACADFNKLRQAWGAAILSVHLSTFSRGSPAMANGNEMPSEETHVP